MPYDIVDAHTDISHLDQRLNYVIEALLEKGILKLEEKKEAKG